MAEAEEPRWLKLGEAFERLKVLGITDQTVRAWGDAGRHGLVIQRVGSHRVFREDTVDEVVRRFHAGELRDD
ncbi:hypothetical protein ACQP2P_16595 [Dactylosporangium sp. CA-139114]|uniref:hypothetical protein n=1 Tax=Dactylosporangium sp. CA-139114 TaxID=3239931 RepID=UPI003D958C1E